MTQDPAAPLTIAEGRASILAEAQELASTDPLRGQMASYDLQGLFAALDDSLTHAQTVTAGPDDLLRSEALAMTDAAPTFSVASLQALYLTEAVWTWVRGSLKEVDSESASRLAFATAWTLRLAGLRKLTEADRLRYRDDLTALQNRVAFDRDIANELSRASVQEPVAIVVIDLDGFKEINEQMGHLGGNAVLQQFAEFLGRAKGADGSAYRWGGDEFALLFPGVGAAEAADRMTAAAAASPARFSWGLAIGASPVLSADALVETADQRLYAMKARHRGFGHRLRACLRALRGPGKAAVQR